MVDTGRCMFIQALAELRGGAANTPHPAGLGGWPQMIQQCPSLPYFFETVVGD